MDCREKNENKVFVEKIFGGLSFRGLSFRGLSFRGLSFRPFEILQFLKFLTLFRHSALATEMDCREKNENKAFV